MGIGMFSAAASLGVSLLWDTDVGLSQIDKYAYATEEHIKVRLSFLIFLRSTLQYPRRANADAMRLTIGWSDAGERIDSFWCSNGDGRRSRFTL